MPTPRVILIEPEAPRKPVVGAPCNGCGVCCLAEPCPVGMVVSLRRHGACKALRWSDEETRYFCGMLKGRRGLWRWLLRRWISAGTGCDCELESGDTRSPPQRKGAA